MSRPDASAEVLAAAAPALYEMFATEDAFHRFVAALDERTLQILFAAVVKAYVAKRDAGAELSPLLPDEETVTATEATVAANALLEAVRVEVIELSMWGALGSL
jgi:hypothetical protein